ncbi:NAD(+) diphosphatase [Pseudobutyrivibrio sp.]|uniref:NAD(+) diphosphatase n=1 Tax=Pseudobutyrivibrio sp. TaxID=2014367 RepID=UPI001D6995BC|nr:NAD(+) diphosphatase [Pseudobutyrivibrio sp.]MBE5911444.1 NAD(+) diphosphatase [Pseudobutyrivibrio sp.]
MIQDIFPKKLSNSYKPEAVASENSLIIVHEQGQLLLDLNEDTKNLAYPMLKDFKETSTPIYMFSIDDEDFFYVTDYQLKEDRFQLYNMKQLRSWYLSPQHYVFAAFTALQLAEWYETTKYCGKCGHENIHSNKERAMVCPHCGNIIYPRINPAVIVGVINGDKILLTKYRTGFAHYALIAGFTEIGETMEETVQREVMEEAGIKVKNIRYYKSQPWGIASDILLGYYCEVDGDDTIKMDSSELKFAEWVNREDVVLQPLEYSLTNEMMTNFKEGRI